MDRRSFLKLFAAAAPVAAVAPTYFFAPKGGWEPQRFMSVDYGLDPAYWGLVYYSNESGIYEYDGLSRRSFVMLTEEISTEEAKHRFPYVGGDGFRKKKGAHLWTPLSGVRQTS